MNNLLKIISFFCLAFSLNPIFASPIDLTESDMYVRQGFDIKWIKLIPNENDKAWQKFPAKKGDRSVQARQLKFKNIPKF